MTRRRSRRVRNRQALDTAKSKTVALVMVAVVASCYVKRKPFFVGAALSQSTSAPRNNNNNFKFSAASDRDFLGQITFKISAARCTDVSSIFVYKRRVGVQLPLGGTRAGEQSLVLAKFDMNSLT